MGYLARLYLIILIISVLHFNNFGQSQSLDNAGDYKSVFYRETIHAISDREGYVAGDTIYISGLLYNPSTLRRSDNMSKYIYVDMLNPYGVLIKRVKLKIENGYFSGYIPLESNLPESSYTLAAYTLYMRNFPEKDLWRKNIDVANRNFRQLLVEYHIERSVLYAKLYDKDTRLPVKPRLTEVFDHRGKSLKRVNNSAGISVHLPDSSPFVKLKFDDKEKIIGLPYDIDNLLSVSVFPEGGVMVPDNLNIALVEVTDEFGRPVEISGLIVSEEGEQYDSFSTDSKGRTQIILDIDADKRYYLEINNRRYPFPQYTDENVALTITPYRNEHILVNVHGRLPKNPKLHVISQNESIVDIQSFPLIIPKKSLGHGLFWLVLSDEDNNIISSRRCYNSDGLTDAFEQNSELPSLSEEILRNLYEEGKDDIYNLRYNYSSLFEFPDSLPFPVEQSGELSGIIKSRWKNKPLEGAKINVIAPQIGLAAEASTNKDGAWVIDGINWPDGTVFVFQALSPKGNREHNFIVTSDTLPTVKPIMPRYLETNGSYQKILEEVNGNVTELDELIVTTEMSAEQAKVKMCEAIGIRTFEVEDFKSRGITGYEEVLQLLPGVMIRNGRITSNRRSGIGGDYPEVEIWIDEVKWTPSFSQEREVDYDTYKKRELQSSGEGSSLSSRATKTAKIMTGNLLSEKDAAHVYAANLSTISELNGTCPFSNIKSISFVPPQAATFLSSSAAYGGGALVITTKDGSERSWDENLFIQLHRPLGYQSSKP